VANDDLSFTPPGPKTGSHLRVNAVRAPGGELVTDAIVDDGQSKPKRRRFHTLDELREFVGTPMEGAAWSCGCAVLFDAIGGIRVYEPCDRHRDKLTG